MQLFCASTTFCASQIKLWLSQKLYSTFLSICPARFHPTIALPTLASCNIIHVQHQQARKMPSPDDAAPRDTGSRRALLKLSTSVQTISAISFSGFLVLHLAAPIGAGLGLDASSIMFLTREYYQTPLLEPILVWGSLGAHVASSSVRRAILGVPRKPSLHSATGWLLVPMTLAHAFTHRILPAWKGISPALLSYQYVSHALMESPFVSMAIYGTMVLAVVHHGIAGARALISGRRKAARLPQGGLAATGYAVLIGSLGLGLVNLKKEGSEVPLWLAKRYMEVWDTIYLR